MKYARRDFLKLSAMAAASAALPVPATSKVVNGIPYRPLGKVGVDVSILTVGGSHIGQDDVSEAEAIKIVRAAIDEGVNFMDNAWSYHRGASEERMGKALRDGYREKVFLMTKVLARSAKGAQMQLDASLRRLDVDAIDLWQVHSVGNFPNDETNVFEKGVLDVALKAKDQGKIKHIGFTGHRDPLVHAAIFDGGFDWETIQMPLNCYDIHNPMSFVHTMIPKAEEKGLGIIAMKTMAGGQILSSGGATPGECLRFAMNLPVSTVVSGMDSFEKLQQNLAVAKAFEPFEPEELDALLAKTRPYGQTGDHESYKHRRS